MSKSDAMKYIQKQEVQKQSSRSRRYVASRLEAVLGGLGGSRSLKYVDGNAIRPLGGRRYVASTLGVVVREGGR